VLAHQAVVDECWDQVLVPRLRARFPQASEQDLREARLCLRRLALGGSRLLPARQQIVLGAAPPGGATRAGEYELADEAHAELLQRLARGHFANLSPDLGADLLAYFRDIDASAAGKDADEVLSALAELQSVMSERRQG